MDDTQDDVVAVTPSRNKNDDVNERAAALATAAAERIARKEAELIPAAHRSGKVADVYAKHASFIAAALNVSIDEAQKYCNDQLAYIQDNPSCIVEHFEEIARCKLERLALKGHL
jgi:hypothetical protein